MSNLVKLADLVQSDEVNEQFRSVIAVLAGHEVSPSRVLVSGPPGCGKLTFTQAAANEANATFLYLCVQWSTTEAYVRERFAEARLVAGPVMLCIDEAETLGEPGLTQTLNRLLEELDMHPNPHGMVVVLVCREAKQLDESLRARFDFHISISPLTDEGLVALLLQQQT